MEKGMMKKLLLLITYAVVLVAVIVKIDTVSAWVKNVVTAFYPLFFGVVVAFVLYRPCNFFARHLGRVFKGKARALARPLAVAISYVILLAVVAAVLGLVIPALTKSIETFAGNLSIYAANLQVLYDKLVTALDLELLANVDLPSIINGLFNRAVSSVLEAVTVALPRLITMTGAVVSALITLLLSLVFSVYMLYGAPRLLNQIRRLLVNYLPQKLVKPTLSVARLTADTFTKYVSGQLTEACILGVLCFLGMCIFRFDYAPLISVIIAVSALVPVAGAYIGAALAALLLVMIRPMEAVWFLVFLVILQQLEGNLIYPRVVGTSIGLPGIWVLAAVAVGGSLLGPIGLIISVPLAAVLYTLLKRDLRRRENLPAEDPKEL